MSKPIEFYTTTMLIAGKNVNIPLPNPIQVIEKEAYDELKAKAEKLAEALEFYAHKPFKALGEWVIVEPGRMSDDFTTYNNTKAKQALKEYKGEIE